MLAPTNSAHLSAHGKFVILFASAMTIMASATISPSLPGLKAEFGDVPNIDLWVRLILTLPSLTVALSAMLFGLIIDRVGRKPILMASIIVYAISGTSGYIANSIDQILIGRALLGLAKAALLTVCTTLVADYFSGAAMRGFMGLQSAAIKIGGVALIFSAGFMAEAGWRLPFLLYGAILLTLPGAITQISEIRQTVRSTNEIDGQEGSQNALWIAVFLVLVVFVSQAVFYQLPLELPFFIVEQFNGGGREIGGSLSFAALVAGGFGLAYGSIRKRLGFISIFAISFVCLGGGLIAMGSATTFAHLLISAGIVGIGAGLVIPNAAVWMAEAASRTSLGVAIGAITASTFLGQFASPLLLSPLSGSFGLRSGFQMIGAANVLIALLLLAPAIFNRSQPDPSSSQSPSSAPPSGDAPPEQGTQQMEIDNEFLKSCRQPRPESEAHIGPHLASASLEQSWAYDSSVVTLFADYEHTGNAYACFQHLHGQGRGPQPARRLEEHAFLFVLEGSVEAYVGSQTIQAQTDTTIFVPRGEIYWYTVTSQTAKVLYIVSSADTFDDRKTAEIEVAKAHGEPARYLGLPSTAPAPDLSAFISTSQQNGVEYPGLSERGWQDSRKFGLSDEERKQNKRPESEHDLAPFVNSRSADSSVWYIGQLISFYMRGTDTGGVACLFEGCPPRGFAPPPHIHLYEHETFFLRSGSIKASCAGTQVEAVAPALLFLPRGLVHIFVSTSDDTKMLSWTNPTDSKRKLYTADVRIFELMGEPAGDLATPPPPTDVPDFETAIKIGLENGIVFPGMADPEGQGWEVGAGAEE